MLAGLVYCGVDQQSQAQEPKPASKTQRPETEMQGPEIEETVSEPQHEINKTAVIIGVFGLGALLFIALH